MSVQHKDLSDPVLHEPIGASTALDGQVYISDGVGSGVWTTLPEDPHNKIAYADKALDSADGTPVDIAVPAAGDVAGLRSYDNYLAFTSVFADVGLKKDIDFDLNGDFIIATKGVYQFNFWMSQENTMSKETVGITLFRTTVNGGIPTGPTEGPVLTDKTKDLGGGEPSVDDFGISGIVALDVDDVVGICVSCVIPGTMSIFDGSFSLVLLEEIA